MYLLDVSVLVALADSSHIHHVACHTWFANVGKKGWATCPITENGFVRVFSAPALATGAVSVQQSADLLRAATKLGGHSFIQDSISLLDSPSWLTQIRGYRQVTDTYLLALCEQKKLRLAT